MAESVRRFCNCAAFAACLLLGGTAIAGNAQHPDDPHYTASGFFDIHVCNWPDRPPFYLALYSTTHFNEVESVRVYGPDGHFIDALALDKYSVIKHQGKPEKRVFMKQIPIAASNQDGWYRAEVRVGNDTDSARDFVIHQLLPQASGLNPVNGAEIVDIPPRLSWNPVDGAAWYQVYIRDQWNDGKLIYTSKLINKPWIELPQGLLEAGGYYSWKVHARDVDSHIQLGDFNIGSQSEWIEFTVRSD
jgi:hypothetical protein